MKVIGIDPGLVVSGYGLVASDGIGFRLIEAGTIESGKTSDSLPVRLRRLFEELGSILQEHEPDVMALEQLYSHYEHPRTAILMGHARGVICLAAGIRNIPTYDYASTQVKSALTGNGRASKAQIQQMVRRTLQLAETPDPPDVADAIAIAMCHVHHEASGKTDARLRALRR